jgi:biotin synthase
LRRGYLWTGKVRRRLYGFDAWDRLVDYGFDKNDLEAVMQSGKTFQASGCPGRQDDVSACNRLYGDSMPEGIRSPPLHWIRGMSTRVRHQLQGEDICTYEE